MNKIWFFGDSYCAYNENWVSDLAQKCNCEVAHLGLAGSSLTYLLHDLLNNKDKIQPQDRVVILFTGIFRDFLNGSHFQISPNGTKLSNSTRPGILSLELVGEIKEGLNTYYRYFFNEQEYKVRAGMIVSHIINSVIPTIQSDKVIYHYSLLNNELLEEISPYVNKREYEPIDFTTFGFTFCQEHFPDIDPSRIILSQDRTYGGVNHWVKHPQFKDKWWKTYEPIFKDLF